MRVRTLSPSSACLSTSFALSGVVPSIFHWPWGRALRGGRAVPVGAAVLAGAGLTIKFLASR